MGYDNYKWTRPFRKDVKGLIEKKGIIQRIIDRNMVALMGSGSPFIIWHHGYDLLKKTSPSGSIDICWCNRNGTPDARHRICNGTGYLVGYQRYGYKTITWSTTSADVTLDNVRVQKDTKKEYWLLSSGLTGTVTTDWIPLTDIKEYCYFIHTESDGVNNTITYEYSYNDTTWIAMPSDISSLDLSQTQIKIRVTLARTSINDRLPYVEWFRFRFRDKQTLGEQYVEYKNSVFVPAYVASKTFTQQLQSKQNQGLTFDFPLTFWSIINEDLGPRDVGMFLKGHYINRRFYQYNIRESTYGEDCTLLHVTWDTRWVYSADDTNGIVYNLD